MTYLTSRSSGIFILSLLFFISGSTVDLSAQNPIKSNIKPFFSSSPLNQRTPNDLKIIGVMVEFQPDTNRFTSGNGTFQTGSIPYMEDPGTNIDTLPHDTNYFEAHLEFSKNYFQKVSRNQLSIEFQVIPQIFKLPYKMEHYSPIGENPDLTEMRTFLADVWEQVAAYGTFSTNFSPADDIAFVIFHAGVGRDIELTGTNLNKTPQDLPSFYLGKKDLSQFLDDPSFSGFPVNNGDLLVTNSLIVPRTLTRSGTDAIGNPFVLPISINGLLTAQIGSHLGLPDLFNTETGNSGIGRFGLMDGAGIFSYNGLFPPELSAWEKVFLGWETPFLVETDVEQTISLPAVSTAQNQSIARIPLSTTEYFLIENRHRDPNGNGVTITTKRSDGSYVDQIFKNADLNFTNQGPNFDELLEPGVVVNVSNYDFSLPGGLLSGNDGSERYLNGGILIWHIDEGVIDSNVESGGVNNNTDRKGVDLEEADGAQDIGIPTSIGLSQNEVNGSPFDFWWSGNDARVITPSDTIQFYENRFGPNTIPSNESYSGATSNFELFGFSDNQPVALFSLRPVNPFSDLYEIRDEFSDLQINTASSPGDFYWNRYPLASQPFNDEWILIPGYNGIRFYNYLDKRLSDSKIEIESLQQPLIKDDQVVIGNNPQRVEEETLPVSIYRFENETITKLSDFKVQKNSAFISSHQENTLDIDNTTFQIDLSTQEIIQNAENIQFSNRIGSYQSRIENGLLILDFPNGTETHLPSQSDNKSRLYTGIIEASQNRIFFYLLENGTLSLYSPYDNYASRILLHYSDQIDWPAIADFDQDSNPDFVFVDQSANQLVSKNISGALLSSFPIQAPEGVQFIGTPLIADIDGDGLNDIIISGYDESSMNLWVINEKGDFLDGFPLLVGGITDPNSHPVHPLIAGNILFAVSHTDEFRSWDLKKIKNIQWQGKYGNQTVNKVSGFIDSDEPAEPRLSLLNSDETYNWPNPARDQTQIRFKTSQPAEIRVKVLKMSGRIISDQTFQSMGQVPQEVSLDTSDWASGGYYALIEAKAAGKTERKLIKIAITR